MTLPYSETKVVPAQYDPDPLFTIPFNPRSLVLINHSTGATITVSFDKTSQHGVLTPGVPGIRYDSAGTFTRIWAKASDAPSMSIVAQR